MTEKLASAILRGLPQTLTMAEFQSMMGTEKYRKDPAYAARVDAIRRASKQAGIA